MRRVRRWWSGDAPSSRGPAAPSARSGSRCCSSAPRRDLARRRASPRGRSGARRSPSGSRPRPPSRATPRPRSRARRRGRRSRGSSCASLARSPSRCSPARRRASRCTSARRRRTCCCRCTSSSSSAALALAWELFGDDGRVARARPARLAARALRRLGGVCVPLVEDSRQGAIDLLFFVLPFGLLAVALARLPWSRGWAADALRPARRDGARLRGDRDLAVRDAQHLLEPEGDRRQRLRAEQLVLPRQLGLLRPVDLRAFPRRRRSSRASSSCCSRRAIARRGRRCVASADHLGGARCRRSRSRASWRSASASSSRSRVALAPARDRADRRSRRPRSSRSRSACRRPATGSSARPRLSHATGGRSKLVSNGVKVAHHHPVIGVGTGGFRRAYAKLTHLQGQGAEGGRVAHDTRSRSPPRRGCPASRCSPGSSGAALDRAVPAQLGPRRRRGARGSRSD